jgi:hypothetical protein
MMRRKFGYSEGVGATYHGLLSPLLLGAGAHVAPSNFAGLQEAEEFAATSAWHLSVSSIFFVIILESVKNSHAWTFLKKISKVEFRIEVKFLALKKVYERF